MVQVVAVFFVLGKGSSYGLGSVPPRTASLALAGAIVAVFATILLVKHVSVAVGSVVSRYLFPGDPLKKLKSLHKFRDQMWQLAIHVSMTSLEAYILFYEGGETVSWYSNYAHLWVPHPHAQNGLCAQTPQSIQLLYVLQMAIWIDTCFGHRFLEERHKDYFVMYLHHVVTIALVGVSYHYNYTKIGTIVLFVHDASDVPLDLLKIFNYCQLEGPKGLFLVELDYVLTVYTWVHCRFYLFGLLLFRGVICAPRELGFAPQAIAHQVVPTTCEPRYTVCMAGYDKARKSDGFGRGHVKGALLGDGSFDVRRSFDEMGWGSHECLPVYWEAIALLSTLQLLHYVWFCMLINIILVKLTESTEWHDSARDVYEGESDEEAEADPKPVAAKKAD
jgi:ceramide synthetase